MSAPEAVESEATALVPTALTTDAARNLATTTKSVPQMQGISSRWLLRVLPWVEAAGGVYRVNRRLSYAVGDGRVDVIMTGSQVRVIPQELGELSMLRGFDDVEVLTGLANRFMQLEFRPGDTVVEFGHEADTVFIVARGKLKKVGVGQYGDPTMVGVLADGETFGEASLVADGGLWDYGVKAITNCILLALPRQAFQEVVGQSQDLQAHLEAFLARRGRPRDSSGEAAIEVASGHDGEPALPSTYVAYDTSPREYELSVAQTVLKVHTRVADLYNVPMNQVDQQLRLTIEALRERQEYEIVNNRDFGLLHNAEFSQRISTRTGPPTPDDLDDLISLVWKSPHYFIAHAQAIAAFGRECSRRGIYPGTVDFSGHHVPSWRGIPILPCNKMPISDSGISSFMLMRTGEATQGVVGLHQIGLPDEYQPGLSVRFMGINEQAIISYLVSTYFSASVLVPDALAVLENVELSRQD